MKSDISDKTVHSSGSTSSLILKKALKRASEIELCIKQLSEYNSTGRHRSVFSGTGSDFSEIKEYVFGDDIRAVDWNSTARFCKTYVRVFTEEHDMAVYLLVDRSESGSFGKNVSKNERIFEIAASILFSAQMSGDSAGLCLFTDDAELFIPAGKGRKHMAFMLNKLILHEAKSPRTDLKKAMSFLCSRIKKKSLVIILSDFDSPDFENQILHLNRKHDVRVIRIKDGSEYDMPDSGYFILRDSESGEELLVNTSNETFRENYKRIVKSVDAEQNLIFRKCGIKYIDIFTDEDFIPALKFCLGHFKGAVR